MNSVFKISKTGTCGITITGLELDNGEYLKDTDILISTRNFKYTHCATINAISTIKYDETKTTKIYEVVDHKLHQIDETTFTVPVDGLYEVTHIIIPNNDWLNYVIETDPQSLYAYKTIMFYDTINKLIKEFKIISNEEPEWIDMLEKETYIQWETRRNDQLVPKKTSEHEAWWKFINNSFEKKIWLPIS